MDAILQQIRVGKCFRESKVWKHRPTKPRTIKLCTQPPILKTDRFRMPTVSPICQYRHETMAEKKAQKGTYSESTALIRRLGIQITWFWLGTGLWVPFFNARSWRSWEYHSQNFGFDLFCSSFSGCRGTGGCMRVRWICSYRFSMTRGGKGSCNCYRICYPKDSFSKFLGNLTYAYIHTCIQHYPTQLLVELSKKLDQALQLCRVCLSCWR